MREKFSSTGIPSFSFADVLERMSAKIAKGVSQPESLTGSHRL